MPFELGHVFEIYSPKKRFNANAIKFGGKYPYVARGSANNGIRGYITEDEQYLSPAKSLSFGQDTATVFYQPDAYFTGDKIKVMVLRNHELNAEIAQYLITVIKKAFSAFAWGQCSFDEKILKSMKIILPVVKHSAADYEYTIDDIDYEYMQERIKEIECDRIRMLDAYLAASDLDDYELTDEDKTILTEDKPMRDFVVGEVFEKLKSPFHGHQKKQESVSRVRTEEYSLPLINCKLGNNGIMYYGRPGDFTSHERVLGVIYNGPPTEGQTYYHEKAGVFTDAYLIGLKDQEIASREIGLYLTTALNKSIHNETRRRYSRGNKATWEGKVEADPIVLPVKLDGDIDFDYMERYIRAIEKLVIADVVKYKNKVKSIVKQNVRI